MADINHVVLVGRLVRDAELKFTAGGQAVCKFSIAINRRRKNGDQWEDEANFFDVTLWGRQGESLNQYLLKGKQVGVEGELKQDRWQQDGQARTKVEIVANNIQLLGSGGASSGGGSSGTYGPSGQGGPSNNRSDNSPDGGSDNSGDGHFTDDIPF